jgi:small conductance mechanosensitive channel
MEETVATTEVGLWNNLINSVQTWFNEGALDMLLDVLGIVAILVVGKIAIMLITRILRKVFNRSRKINDLMARFLVKVVATIGWIMVLLVIIGRLGVDLAPIIAGLGITGFILGFAFQETIGNLLAGVMIILNSPFRIGDYVDVGSLSGTVREMDMMCVTLSTPDNKRVILANKLVWGNAIVNYSYTDNRRVEMGVSIAYGSDIAKAKQVIKEILDGYAEVLLDPAPTIEVNKLNNSSVDFVVRPWTKPADYWAVYFRFQQDVLERFKQAGIAIPFQQVDVYVRDVKGFALVQSEQSST